MDVTRPKDKAASPASWKKLEGCIPGLVGLLILVAIGWRTTTFLSLGEAGRLAFIPDDAFYYLILARNFLDLGFWTFDGESTATGFHLLHGYFLVLLYSILPGAGLSLMGSILAVHGWICFGAGAWLVTAAAVRSFGIGAGVGYDSKT